MRKNWGTAESVCEHLLPDHGSMSNLTSINGWMGLQADYVMNRLRYLLARSVFVRSYGWKG